MIIDVESIKTITSHQSSINQHHIIDFNIPNISLDIKKDTKTFTQYWKNLYPNINFSYYDFVYKNDELLLIKIKKDKKKELYNSINSQINFNLDKRHLRDYMLGSVRFPLIDSTLKLLYLSIPKTSCTVMEWLWAAIINNKTVYELYKESQATNYMDIHINRNIKNGMFVLYK